MLEKYNFHWQEGFLYNFPKRRKVFEKLLEEVKSRQIISLIGLRRVGKTTLLRQLIDNLVQSEKVKRDHIVFYSFDEEQPRIDELLKEYEIKTGIELMKMKDKVYVFLDEIQKLEDWQNQIKYFYDSYKNIKFFVSGSSSLFIKKHSQESLAGRIYEFVMHPLSFEEFLTFRDKNELLNKRRLMSESIQKEFSRYQKRQFIEVINESEEKVSQYIKTVIEKITFQDIPKIFSIENEEVLMKILRIIASNPGLLSDYESLSRETGVSRVTVSNYFYYLEESFLVKKLYNFSRNMITSEKKMKKYYLYTPSFFPYLNSQIDESKLIENLIVSGVRGKFFWRTPQKYEVDLIMEENGKILPIEVKYKNQILEKDLKNLVRFCDKFGIKGGVLVTKDLKGKRKKGNLSIELIPAWEFLLEYGK